MRFWARGVGEFGFLDPKTKSRERAVSIIFHGKRKGPVLTLSSLLLPHLYISSLIIRVNGGTANSVRNLSSVYQLLLNVLSVFSVMGATGAGKTSVSTPQTVIPSRSNHPLYLSVRKSRCRIKSASGKGVGESD